MGGVGRGDHGGGKDMKKHIRNYLRHHGYGEQDTILCEKCGKIANRRIEAEKDKLALFPEAE